MSRQLLNLFKRDSKKVGIFFPHFTEVTMCSPRNQNFPLAESFDAVKIQCRFHRLNLRISSRDIFKDTDILVRPVSLCSLIVDSSVHDHGRDIVSLQCLGE